MLEDFGNGSEERYSGIITWEKVTVLNVFSNARSGFEFWTFLLISENYEYLSTSLETQVL